MKTITIHQGNGDDLLEMTVKVTNKEYATMEKIRKTDPSVWEGREFELLKTARESVNSTKTNHKFNWKIWIVVAIVLAVAFGVIAILTTNGSEKIEEKDLLSFESQYQQSSTQEENLRRMYNKLTSLGMESSLDEFIDYLDASDEHRQKVYNKLVNNGSKGSYDQFLEFIGYDNVEISAYFFSVILEKHLDFLELNLPYLTVLQTRYFSNTGSYERLVITVFDCIFSIVCKACSYELAADLHYRLILLENINSS